MNHARVWPAMSGLGLSIIAAFFLAACSSSGGELFSREGCIHCHRFGGKGGNMGPDLTAVTERRTADWISEYLKDPRGMNPESRMPPYDHLTWLQRKAIYAYLDQ